MAEEIWKTPCPMCKTNLSEINNMGIYQAKCKLTGKVKGEEEVEREFCSQFKKSFLTFSAEDKDQREWSYLKLQVKEK